VFGEFLGKAQGSSGVRPAAKLGLHKFVFA